MATIRQQFQSEDSAILKSYQKMQKEVADVHDELRRLSETSQRGHQKQQQQSAEFVQGMKNQAQALQNTMLGVLSLRAAWDVVSDAIQHHNSMARRALDMNISVADSQARISATIGRVTDPEFQQFLGGVQDIQTRAKFPQVEQLNVAAASILSATRGDRQLTLEILGAAAPFFRHDPTQLAPFGGAMGDVMRQTGRGVDETLSLMLAILGQSRFEDLGGFKMVAPAIATAVKTQAGVDQLTATRQAAAMFAAFGGEFGDVEGARSKTFVAAMSAKLEEVFPERGLSLFERLEKIREGPQDIRDEFLKSGFEQQTKAFAREMITDPNSAMNRGMVDAFQNMVADQAFVTEKREQMAGGTEQLRRATRDREFEAQKQRVILSDERADLALARQQFNDAMEATSRGALAGPALSVEQLEFDLTRGNVQRQIRKLQERERFVRTPPMSFFDALGMSLVGGRQRERTDAELSPAERETIQLVQQAINTLEGLKRNSDISTDDLRGIRQNTRAAPVTATQNQIERN